MNSTFEERRTALITCIRTLRDVSETLQRGDSGGKFVPGSRTLSMPAAYNHGSYSELVRALVALRGKFPNHYKHLRARYLASERSTKELIRRGDIYHRPRPIMRGLTMVADDPLPRNTEVLAAITMPKVHVASKPGPKQVYVRAIVESWEPWVLQRMVERGLDGLLFLMPYEIRLPRDVLEPLPARQVA